EEGRAVLLVDQDIDPDREVAELASRELDELGGRYEFPGRFRCRGGRRERQWHEDGQDHDRRDAPHTGPPSVLAVRSDPTPVRRDPSPLNGADASRATSGRRLVDSEPDGCEPRKTNR